MPGSARTAPVAPVLAPKPVELFTIIAKKSPAITGHIQSPPCHHLVAAPFASSPLRPFAPSSLPVHRRAPLPVAFTRPHTTPISTKTAG
ncbi:unnamed protein product, partial [Rhizoctonia solani]